MTSRHPSTEADIRTLSELRSGSRLIGVRTLRAVARSSTHESLLGHCQWSLNELLNEIGAIARDDGGTPDRREKAAEFIVLVRTQASNARSVSDIVDLTAEAAASIRYRSGRIIDFLASWVFVAGEQFIATLEDPRTALDLEVTHLDTWSRFRSLMLEVIEAGAERLHEGRRFRFAETYLARLRVVRARNEQRSRRLEASLIANRSDDLIGGGSGPDYVSAMVVDMFMLGLTDQQQALVVSQIPGPQARRGAPGFADHDYRRLWAPLRATRTDQAFQKWPRLREGLGISQRQATLDYTSGLATHLRRTWEWFFPDRNPFGILRSTLGSLGAAADQDVEETREEEFIASLFRQYSETLSFIVRLATEDAASAILHDDEAQATGAL